MVIYSDLDSYHWKCLTTAPRPLLIFLFLFQQLKQ